MRRIARICATRSSTKLHQPCPSGCACHLVTSNSLGLPSAGTYTSEAGASACIDCPAGKFLHPPCADGSRDCTCFHIGICTLTYLSRMPDSSGFSESMIYIRSLFIMICLTISCFCSRVSADVSHPRVTRSWFAFTLCCRASVSCLGVVFEFVLFPKSVCTSM